MKHFAVALSAFAICAFGGFAFTAFCPMTLPDWWLYPALRVSSQLGTAVWLGLAIALMFGGLFDKPGLLALAICTLVGAGLCLNPLLDLLAGPETIDGMLVENQVIRSAGRNRRIEVIIKVRTHGGTVREFSPVGAQANRWVAMGCERSQPVSLTALRHLDVVIDSTCAAGGARRPR